MNAQNKSSGTKLRAALFAPSGPPGEEETRAGLSIIEKEAPWIEIEPVSRVQSPAAGLSYLAAGDRDQAEAFNRLMSRPGLDILWAVRGGYGTLRWVGRVKVDAVARADKRPLLVGFSDLTVLHAFLLGRGIKTLHAPLITTLSLTSGEDRAALWDALLKQALPRLQGDPLLPGRARGRLIGGNLACIASTLATPWEPPWEGSILLIEDVNEPLYRIDRMLTQLLLSGRLHKLAGVAAGELAGCHGRKDELKTLLLDRLQGLGIPAVWNLPVGHGARNAPVLLGASYVLHGDGGTLAPGGPAA